MKPRKATHDWWERPVEQAPLRIKQDFDTVAVAVGDYVICVDMNGDPLPFLHANRYRLAVVVNASDNHLAIRFPRNTEFAMQKDRTYGISVSTSAVQKAYGCFPYPIEVFFNERET